MPELPGAGVAEHLEGGEAQRLLGRAMSNFTPELSGPTAPPFRNEDIVRVAWWRSTSISTSARPSVA